ncbi:MAG: hypothetical protein IJ461_00335 [Clostridia bacterium]|nr:hypothetical protein [Clostridia bacterium]
MRVNEGEPVALTGNVYTASESGEYTLRFVIQDSANQVLANSVKYTLNLDFSTESAIRKQAWMLDAEGNKVYGTLAGLLGQPSADGRIYLQTGETIVLSQGASALAGVTLLPDPGIFSSGSHRVIVTHENPATVSESKGQLYIWVAPVDGGESSDTVELTVAAADYASDRWMSKAPTFALMCSSEIAEGLAYGVKVNNSTPIILKEASYTAQDQGQYILTFVVMDGAGQVVAASDSYPISLDTTAPAVLATVRSASLTLACQDDTSGLAAFSLDGGATWTDLEGVGTYSSTFTYSSSQTFGAGTIRVKDRAGLEASVEQELAVTVQTRPSFSYGGYGGGGSSRTTSHAKSTTEAVVAYNGVELLVEDETMTRLSLGGEELDVTLAVSQPVKGSSYEPSFTAYLTTWGDPSSDEEPDTLVLTALTEPEQDHAYLWNFNGMAYKKLAASGIDYLVFQVGDQVTALSTAGFTAGLRYNLYKSAGLGSKAFEYQLMMDASQAQTALYLTVEGESFQVMEDSSELYYYDLYIGNQDMMNLAFGAAVTEGGQAF